MSSIETDTICIDFSCPPDQYKCDVLLQGVLNYLDGSVRQRVACDTKGLVIAVSRDTGKQLGFLWTTSDEVIHVHLLVSHDPSVARERIGMFLLDHLVKTRSDKKIMIEPSLVDASDSRSVYAKWILVKHLRHNYRVLISDPVISSIVKTVIDCACDFPGRRETNDWIKFAVKAHTRN